MHTHFIYTHLCVAHFCVTLLPGRTARTCLAQLVAGNQGYLGSGYKISPERVEELAEGSREVKTGEVEGGTVCLEGGKAKSQLKIAHVSQRGRGTRQTLRVARGRGSGSPSKVPTAVRSRPGVSSRKAAMLSPSKTAGKKPAVWRYSKVELFVGFWLKRSAAMASRRLCCFYRRSCSTVTKPPAS